MIVPDMSGLRLGYVDHTLWGSSVEVLTVCGPVS
jgi:hypothetical protein